MKAAAARFRVTEPTVPGPRAKSLIYELCQPGGDLDETLVCLLQLLCSRYRVWIGHVEIYFQSRIIFQKVRYDCAVVVAEEVAKPQSYRHNVLTPTFEKLMNRASRFARGTLCR